MPDEFLRYLFNEETPRQQVSNRSILRVQQLSNELKDDLNRMELFKQMRSVPEESAVKQVLFVARDYRHEDVQRWYNFRLCATYGFEEEAFDAIKSNKKGIEDLFTLANEFDPQTAANRERFEQALVSEEAALKNPNPSETEVATFNRREALDQLLIALAVIPYTGLLPSLLENSVLPDKASESLKSNACFFVPTQEKDKFVLRPFNSFSDFEWIDEAEPETWDEFTIKSSKKVPNLKLVENLFNNFLLPFTRGAWKGTTHSNNESSEKKPNEDIFGFAVPAYDTWNEPDGWRGGMAGWLVVFLDPKTIEKIMRRCAPTKDDKESDFFRHSWLHLADLVRAYVRKIREANISDLLEDYAELRGSTESPRDYFLNHIHQVIGWKWSAEPTSEDDRAKNKKCKIEIPRNNEKDDIKAWVAPLSDTLWQRCGKAGEGTTFPPGTRRICRLLPDGADLVKAKREEGKQSGQSSTFHDTSKDLNVLEDQLQRYTRDVTGVREAVEKDAQALLALDLLPTTAREYVQRIADQAKRLGDPNLDYMLRLQFLMSHLRVKTEGRLYEAPAWCWQLLESGTKRDIYLILRALVWRPFGWAWFDKELKTLPESTLTDDSMTWSRIFLFDEDREESEPRDLNDEVRRSISMVFSKLFFQWHISKADYEAYFPPPDLNRDADWDSPLLWAMSDEDKTHHLQWLPPVNLLPLFIFAMRTAFEHAFLRNFLHVLKADSPEAVKGQKPRAIRISESPGSNPGGARIHHRIHIAFPALGIEPGSSEPMKSEREESVLPYDNWTRHMNHYRHVSHPWHWMVERVAGPLDQDLSDPWHYEITLEARE